MRLPLLFASITLTVSALRGATAPELTELIVAAEKQSQQHLVMLYYHIGPGILENHRYDGSSLKFIPRLREVLRQEFPQRSAEFTIKTLELMR